MNRINEAFGIAERIFFALFFVNFLTTDVLAADALEENAKASEIPEAKFFDNEICVICYSENPKNTIHPCNHRCLCDQCHPLVNNKCPICRGLILAILDPDTLLATQKGEYDPPLREIVDSSDVSYSCSNFFAYICCGISAEDYD